MSWFSKRSKSSSSARRRREEKRRRRRGAGIRCLESLESRNLMAADVGILDGVVTINADPAGTDVQIVDTNPMNPLAAVTIATQSPNGDTGLALSKLAFNSIRFNGSDNDDSFVNLTSKPSRVYGYGGDDFFQGGWATDRLYGQNGNDTLRGGGGDDFLYGGNDDDILLGQNGDDTMYGQSGNDQLMGGDGVDYMYGGSGRDGMYGGSDLDVYNGGSGPDRYLRNMSDGMDLDQNFSAEDVHVNFGNAGFVQKDWYGTTTTFQAGSWSDDDILQVDQTFDVMAQRTNSNILLRDVDGAELNFYRHGNSSTAAEGVSYIAYNAGGDTYYSDQVFTDDDQVHRLVFHEIGHNWDTADEVETALPGQGDAIITNGFRAASQWINSPMIAVMNPAFTISGDGDWSYHLSALFARNYGRTNPAEDFATSFAAYFMDFDGRPYDGGGAAAIPTKIPHLNNLLDQLSAIEPAGEGGDGGGGGGSVAIGGIKTNFAGNELQRATAIIDTSRQLAVKSEVVAAAADINLVGDVIVIDGTSDADVATVHYVNAPGGAPTDVPTDWLRVEVSNSTDFDLAHIPTNLANSIEFDARAGNDQFVNQTWLEAFARGGKGDDLFLGGHATDRFYGGAGDDDLLGRDGNDVLEGGEGADYLNGGDHFDFLVGGAGDDQVLGGGHDDHAFGGPGNDVISGGAGNDILEGEAGDDHLLGDDGRDLLIGGLGSDLLEGGNGDDLLVGDRIRFNNPHVAMHQIWSEWNSGHGYGERARNIARLNHPNFNLRLNANSFLIWGETIQNDGDQDDLRGQGGRDLFFAELGTDLTDDAPGEAVFS